MQVEFKFNIQATMNESLLTLPPQAQQLEQLFHICRQIKTLLRMQKLPEATNVIFTRYFCALHWGIKKICARVDKGVLLRLCYWQRYCYHLTRQFTTNAIIFILIFICMYQYGSLIKNQVD